MKASILLLVVLAFLSSIWAQTCPRCTPLCQNGDGTKKLCGDDGCGGSCGSCPGGQACCSGLCVCVPNCAGKVCGDDGCGGSACGVCSSTQACSNGVCVGIATPECSGKSCGSNNAGGNCGLCAPGQKCRAGQCECYYSCNERNCGNAVQPDGTNFGLCPQRSCGTCPNGFSCAATGRCSAMTPCTIAVTVVDCSTRRAVSGTSSVVISSTTLSYSTTITVASGLPTNWDTPGLGAFTFVTSAQGYLTNTQTNTVVTTTTAIELCINPGTVQVDVRSIKTDRSIEVGATITYSGVVSGTFRWTGITTFTHGGYGNYNFLAVPDSKYNNGTLTYQITSSTTLIIIYVNETAFCGNFVCDPGETAETCQGDCVAIFFEFENADGSGPVNQPTINYFLQVPLTPNADTGPNRNSVTPSTTRTTGNGSNTVLEETYSYNILVYVEVVATQFINFYWRANTTNVDPALGTYRLRVHLSKVLGSTDFNYRVVNTWKPIDATPTPYGPTDLNLHLFHPSGALDINNPSLISSGFAIGKAIADSKQSGGPATMDISPGSSQMVAIWNSKPPRSGVIAPSQNGRFLVDSGSYIVVYGKTSNAAQGKQLGQVVMDEIFLNNPSLKNDRTSDLWYVAQFTVNQPAVNQPSIVAQQKFKQSTITSTKDMIFNCEAYSYCSQFVVPYSDTGRRHSQ